MTQRPTAFLGTATATAASAAAAAAKPLTAPQSLTPRHYRSIQRRRLGSVKNPESQMPQRCLPPTAAAARQASAARRLRARSCRPSTAPARSAPPRMMAATRTTSQLPGGLPPPPSSRPPASPPLSRTPKPRPTAASLTGTPAHQSREPCRTTPAANPWLSDTREWDRSAAWTLGHPPMTRSTWPLWRPRLRRWPRRAPPADGGW